MPPGLITSLRRCLVLFVALPLLAGATFAGAAEPPPACIGSAACGACHTAQLAVWRGSQHAQVIAEATPATVRFVVRTDGLGGRIADYTVK